MTWKEFKNAVEEQLRLLGKDENIVITYIDTDFFLPLTIEVHEEEVCIS